MTIFISNFYGIYKGMQFFFLYPSKRWIVYTQYWRSSDTIVAPDNLHFGGCKSGWSFVVLFIMSSKLPFRFGTGKGLLIRILLINICYCKSQTFAKIIPSSILYLLHSIEVKNVEYFMPNHTNVHFFVYLFIF